MKNFFFLLCVLILSPRAFALDVQECATLADQYAKNPFSLSVGQLDALRLCVAEQMRLMVEEKQNEKESRAIGRSFGKDWE